jgi:hypothetical protein
MKKEIKVALSCCLVISCLILSGCPKPKSRTIEVQCNPTTRQCTFKITVVYFGPTSEFDSQFFANEGIFDLANPWEPDANGVPYSTVTISNSQSQLGQSNFDVQLSNDNLDPVDKDTNPRPYVFANSSDVSGFVSQSFAGEDEVEVKIESYIPVYQSDCSIPTGTYINHLRSKDGTGVTYYDFFNLDYSVPDNIQGGNRCEQSTITIK